MEIEVLTSPESSSKVVKRFLLVTHLCWLALMLGLLSWSIWRDGLQLEQLVEREALVRLESANNIRRWIVGFGGVYAPVSEHHQPNPYIPESANRDIESTTGIQLTIANSISALSHIMGKENRVEGGYIRFTGPDPLKQSNLPDAWETGALRRLAAGEKLLGDFTELEDKPYYRLMQPLYLKPKCYKCHEYRSFELGDIVGGLGVNVDLEVYSGLRHGMYRAHLINYLVIWVIGAVAIGFVGRRWRGFMAERDDYSRQLRELATHDSLTGFLNRHQLDVFFNKELARAKRNHGALSILMVDMDNFKTINDRYGHQAGDKVIKSIARQLQECTRASDYVVRYGGDEFLFLLPESDHARCLEKAEALRKRVASAPIRLDDQTEVRMSLSIGAASYPNHGSTRQELIEQADLAVYKAKQEGRNCACSADEAE